MQNLYIYLNMDTTHMRSTCQQKNLQKANDAMQARSSLDIFINTFWMKLRLNTAAQSSITRNWFIKSSIQHFLLDCRTVLYLQFR